MRFLKTALATLALILATYYAVAGVYDYSTTSASNTTINGVSVPVGALPPSNVGPALRGMAAADAAWADDTGCATSTAGSANAYTFNATSNPYAGALTFADGDTFCFVASFTNSSTATLNVESEGAKAIRKLNDQALVSGDIVSGGHYTVHYDASANSASGAWLLESAPAASPTESLCIAFSDETTAITASTGKIKWRFPYAITVSAIEVSLSTAQGSGNIFTVDINEGDADSNGGNPVSILSTKATIDNAETTTNNAATPLVISDTAIAAHAEGSIDVDQVGNGTAAGGKACFTYVRT